MSKETRQKLFVLLAITLVVVLIVIALLIYIRLNDHSRVSLTESVTFEHYSDEKVEGMEISGAFTESILSAQVNKSLKKSGYLLCESYAYYASYVSKYRDIYPVEPSIKSAARTRFSDDYVALLITTDEFEIPCNIYASCKYTNSEGELIIVLISEPLQGNYRYNTDPYLSKQATAVVYLKRELIMSIDNLTILIQF